MAKEKAPKLHWFCRCSKLQNKRARTRPACGNCGKPMETDDFICDDPSTAPEVPQHKPTPPAPPTPSSGLDALIAARVASLTAGQSTIIARLEKLEARAKTPQTVIEDLEQVLPRMNAEQLAELLAVVDRTMGGWSTLRARAADLIAAPRDPSDEN